MKTRFLIAGLALVTTVSFAQKKEIKKAERSLKSNKYSEALAYLKEAEPMLGNADNDMKAQYYVAKSEATLGMGRTDHKKLLAAAEDMQMALSLDPKVASLNEVAIQTLRDALIQGAVTDQNTENFKNGMEKLYASYMIAKIPSDLYYASGNAVNAKDYDTAIKYYKMLLDLGYTGEGEEYVATEKATGEVRSFENQNLRDIAIKTGEYIKPETRELPSRKGEILRNMVLIYLEKDQIDEATALLKDARAANPNDVYLLYVEADMSYKTGDTARYNQLMNEIIAKDPNNPEVYFNLGVRTAELGEVDKAIGFYEKALQLKPDFENALINIAILKLDGEEKLVEAMNSLGTTPADNKKYDQLKKERQDKYRSTLPYLEKAYKINPENQDVIRTLMNIYSNLGDEAKYQDMKAKLKK